MPDPMPALRLAVRAKAARANLKDSIHDDPTWWTLVDVVVGDQAPELANRIRLVDLLGAAPGMGPAKIRRVLRAADCPRPSHQLALGAGEQGRPLARPAKVGRVLREATCPRPYHQLTLGDVEQDVRLAIVSKLRHAHARLNYQVLERVAAKPRCGSRKRRQEDREA